MSEGIAHPPPRRVARAHLPGEAFITIHSSIQSLTYLSQALLFFILLLIYLFIYS